MTGQVSLSETMLIAASQARSGQVNAEVADLVRASARMVYQIAYSVLRNHHDAEDASQEVFLRVWRYREKLAAVDDPKAWVARIAWRVAVERSARHRPAATVSLDDAAFAAIRDGLRDTATAADEQAARAQMQAWLDHEIPKLPEDMRGALLLSTMGGLDTAEIAAVLDINEGTVRTRLFRARKLLREKLEQHLGTHL